MKKHIFLVACLAAVCLATLIGTLVSANARKLQPASTATTSAKRVVVHAAGRGRPYINLDDGVELDADYTGPVELKNLLEQNVAEPRTLASADFDEDGVPDLICGYARPGGGIITLYRGNVDSIFPNSPEAQRRKADGAFTDSAFLSPARVFDARVAGDFVGAGDFDADGHWDVIIAARGGKKLYLLPGDGKGNLLAARKIALPGRISSLVTGEMNRADGLADVVIGVVADDGPKVMIFEGPEGALKGNPEVFPVAGEPRALALGQLDDDYPMDLAVGAGSELTVVHGRDRKLSLGEALRAAVSPAKQDRRSVGFEIRSIAAGDFRGKHENSLALLAPDGSVYIVNTNSNKTSLKSGKESKLSALQAIGRWGKVCQLVPARVSTGATDDLLMLSQDEGNLRILTNCAVDSASVLPQAAARALTSLEVTDAAVAALPMRLNADGMADLVILKRNSSAPGIVKTTAAMVFTVTNTNASGAGSLNQSILDANSNPGADTITFNIPGAGVHTIDPSAVFAGILDPTTIDGTTQPGFAGKPVIEIGIAGKLFVLAGNSTIRGLATAAGIGLLTNGSNHIEGNFCGTDATGTVRIPLPSGAIVEVDHSSNNIIGGTTVAARNLICGSFFGIQLIGASNQILGNFIGTDITGTVGLTTAVYNILVQPESGNTIIGGTIPGARNIISGGSTGISGGPMGAQIQGNFIGTDVTGTVRIGVGVGIEDAGSQWTIGGTVVTARNIISGNGVGVTIVGNPIVPATGNQIQGNFVGTDVTGTVKVGNFLGIQVARCLSNFVGGNVPGARNLVSGNGVGIVVVSDSIGPAEANQVLGNFIGTDFSGSQDIGNTEEGIGVLDSSGIHPATNNVIANNLVAHNGGIGVKVSSGSRNSIRQNSIFSNGGLGIDLNASGSFFQSDGITANDSCDGDSGPNLLQNYPVLTSAFANGLSTGIHGTLNSAPNVSFTVEFFSNPVNDLSGFGEGQTFIGSSTVTTGSDCNGAFTIALPVAVQFGQFISATATDSDGNTSEFSQCIQVQQGTGFNLCLQDDSNGNILLVNSSTGEYQFSNCKGVFLSGVGSLIKKGCLVTLQVNAPDRKILAKLDACLKSGTASVQIPSLGTTFTIIDRSISNNTCVCSGGG